MLGRVLNRSYSWCGVSLASKQGVRDDFCRNASRINALRSDWRFSGSSVAGAMVGGSDR